MTIPDPRLETPENDPRFEPVAHRQKRIAIKLASIVSLFSLAALTATDPYAGLITVAVIGALAYGHKRRVSGDVEQAIKDVTAAIERQNKADKANGPNIHAVNLEKEMARLSRRLGLPKPTLHPDSGVGPAIMENEHSAILFFDADLGGVLDPHEIENFLLHELAHHRGDHVLGGAFFNAMSSGAMTATGIEYLAGWAGQLGFKMPWLEGMNMGLPAQALMVYLAANAVYASIYSRTNELECDALAPRMTKSGIGIGTGIAKLMILKLVDAYNVNPKKLDGFVAGGWLNAIIGSHPSLEARIAQGLKLTDPKIIKDNPETVTAVKKINEQWLVDFIKQQAAKNPDIALDTGEVIEAFNKLIHAERFQAYMDTYQARDVVAANQAAVQPASGNARWDAHIGPEMHAFLHGDSGVIAGLDLAFMASYYAGLQQQSSAFAGNDSSALDRAFALQNLVSVPATSHRTDLLGSVSATAVDTVTTGAGGKIVIAGLAVRPLRVQPAHHMGAQLRAAEGQPEWA